MNPIEVSILKAAPKAAKSDINLLLSYVSTYNLLPIPSTKSTGPWFLSSQLAEAKGLSPKNVTDYIVRKSRNQKPLRGRYVTLRGESLKSFKQQLSSLGHTPSCASSITILNWEMALDYLMSKHLTSTRPRLEFHSESHLQNLLISFASFSSFNWRQEAAFPNGATTIRLDIYDAPNKIIYELKNEVITPEHIEEKMKYLSILRNHKLIFVSPLSIKREAKKIISSNSSLGYSHVTDLSALILNNIISITPPSGHFFIHQTVIPRFQRILG
jgi:hypothetical protein